MKPTPTNSSKEISSTKPRIVFLLSGFIAAISIILILMAFFYWKDGILNTILVTLGTAGLSAGIVSIAMEVFLNDISSEAITARFKQDIEKLEKSIKKITWNTESLMPEVEKLRQSLDNFSKNESLIRQCYETKIKSLFLNRGYSNDIDLIKYKTDLMECMEKSGEIKMLGTTLRQFFTKDPSLQDKLQTCVSTGKQIKILLANPFTKSVVKRTLLEQGEDFERECHMYYLHYQDSETYRDIKSTLESYNIKFKTFDNVKMKCYNDFPSMWLVITDTCAFFQPYQYGRIEKTKCIGESFIIMRFGRGDAYDLLNKHFDYIWNDKSNIEPDEMLDKYANVGPILREIMKDKDVYWRC